MLLILALAGGLELAPANYYVAGGVKAAPAAPAKTGRGYAAQNAAASGGDGRTTGGSAGTGAGLDNLIKNAAARYGVDRSLVKSVIQAESNFNSSAVSPAGAMA